MPSRSPEENELQTITWTDAQTCSGGPLSGVRVLDLSAWAVGPWAAGLLAALGADVVKIDPPYGDPIRQVRPAHHGEPTTYTASNLGKRDLVLDLKSPEGRAAALRLAAQADIALENSRPGAMARLGLDFPSLVKVNPRIVYCSSSSFGTQGPMAGVGSTDTHGQAYSGFVSLNGAERDDPQFLRYPALVDLGTSSYLTQSCLIGLHWRDRNNAGCHVTTSQFEGALALQVTRAAEYLLGGAEPVPLGSSAATFAPSAAFATRDKRWLAVSAPGESQWLALCETVRRPELADDARFISGRARLAHRRVLEAVLAEAFAAKDLAWWRRRLSDACVPNAEFSVLDDVVAGTSRQPAAALLVRVPHPRGGTISIGAPPWHFSRTPATYAAAPLPGQDQNVFTPQTMPDAEPPQPTPASASETETEAAAGNRDGDGVRTAAALEGLKVVEFAQGISGPYCGWLLSCAGAEVVKVEPADGDYARGFGPAPNGADSALFSAINTGKRLLTDAEATDEALARLLADADVVIADRVSPRLPMRDLDWIRARLPATALLAVASPTETGESATELEIQAQSGLLRYLGAIGQPPVRLGADVGSVLCGSFLTQGVLAAHLERCRSGQGQEISASGVGALMAIASVMLAALDDPDEWEGFHCLSAGHPVEYGLKTADGALSFSAPRRDDEAWRAFCEELGAKALAADPMYLTGNDRVPRMKELMADLSQFTHGMPRENVLAAVERSGAMALPVQRHSEVFAQPQITAIDAVSSLPAGRRLAPPWRINGARPHPRHEVPGAGTPTGQQAPGHPGDMPAGPVGPN